MSEIQIDTNQEFYCFISYKHKKDGRFEKDQSWAEKLEGSFHRTQIKVPPIAERTIIHGSSDDTNEYIGKVYRDFTNLSGGYYEEEIQTALRCSRKLVSLVSDEMLADQNKIVEDAKKAGKKDLYYDAWCYKEIRDFLSYPNHTLDDVILVYIGKQTDFSLDIVPAPLLDVNLLSTSTIGQIFQETSKNEKFKKMSHDEKLKYIRAYWSDRNAILVFKEGEKIGLADLVAAKVACNIFGLKGEGAQAFISFREIDLAREEAVRKKAKLQRLFGILIALIVVVVLSISLETTFSQNQLAKARQALSEGNRRDAMSKALKAYDNWRGTPDLTQFMWATLDPKEPFMSFDSNVAVSKERNEFAAIRDNQYVDIYDGESLSIIKTYDIGHGGTLVYSPNGNKLAVYTNSDLSVLDRTTDTIIHRHKNSWSEDVIQFSPDGEYIYSRNGGLCKTSDIEKQVIIPKLPYHSYSSNVKNSSVSFLGSTNKVAYVEQIYGISDKSPADTLWTVSIYDLSNDDERAAWRSGDVFLEFPDSVSFVHAYNDQPLVFATSNQGVSFWKYDGLSIAKVSWQRYNIPISEGNLNDWPKLPYKIEQVTCRSNGHGFILHSNRGVAFNLNSSRRIEAIMRANVDRQGNITTYNGRILAAGDSLNLVSDNFGHLFLLNWIVPKKDGSLNTGTMPISGCRHNEGFTYSLAKLGDYQFISQSHDVVSGKQTKTYMYWKKDTRELPTLSISDKQWCRYTSPDLNFALVQTNDEFGLYNTHTKEFIPVCPAYPFSSIQDVPLYVSYDGDEVYVQSVADAKETGNWLYNLVKVNLATRDIEVIDGMKVFSKISDGVILGQSWDCSCILDLRRQGTIAQYNGYLDIANNNGLYSVTLRKSFSGHSWYNTHVPLLYDDSSATLKEAPDSIGISSSPHGSYCIKEKEVNGVLEYEISDFSTLNHIITLRGDKGNDAICGMTNNERYFIYSCEGYLTIYDLKKNKALKTQHKINTVNKNKLALANGVLFLPGNTYRIIDLSTGEMLVSIPELEMDNQQVSFSPDEKWMIAGQYLVNIKDRQIMSSSIPYGYNRSLSNEHIVYMNKCFALPRKKALVKQITSILENGLKPNE